MQIANHHGHAHFRGFFILPARGGSVPAARIQTRLGGRRFCLTNGGCRSAAPRLNSLGEETVIPASQPWQTRIDVLDVEIQAQQDS